MREGGARGGVKRHRKEGLGARVKRVETEMREVLGVGSRATGRRG